MNVPKLVGMLALCAPPVFAMEWLSSTDLEDSCNVYLEGSVEPDANLCIAYIQGFLAGVDAAPPLDSNVSDAKEPSGGESFAERATRTRLGRLQLMRLQAAEKADYCLDDSLTAVDIVETVASYLKDHEEALLLTNAEAVYEALVHEYPCEP